MKTWKKRSKKLLIIGPNLFFFSKANWPKSSPYLNSCSIKISHRGTFLKWLWVVPSSEELWTFYAIHVTKCKLFSEHLPTFSCPRSYEWPLVATRILEFVFSPWIVWWEIGTAEINFNTLKTQWSDFSILIRKITSFRHTKWRRLRHFLQS